MPTSRGSASRGVTSRLITLKAGHTQHPADGSTGLGNFSLGQRGVHQKHQRGFTQFLSDRQRLIAGAAWQAFFENAQSYISIYTTLTELTLYAMDDTGHVINTEVGPAKATAVPTAAVDGASSGVVLPLQNTVALSTRTPNTTRRGRGRMYLPAMSVGPLGGSDGLLTSAAAGHIAGTGKTLLNALKVGTFGVTAVVRPVVIGSPWTTYFRITQTRVGNVVDSQRRRRRQITETYESVDL